MSSYNDEDKSQNTIKWLLLLGLDPVVDDWESSRLARGRVKLLSTAAAQNKFDGEFNLPLLNVLIA